MFMDQIDRIDQRLKEIGKTWADMARALETSDQRLGNWKNKNRRTVPSHAQVSVAKYLGVTIDWIKTGEGQKEVPTGSASAVIPISANASVAVNDKSGLYHRPLNKIEFRKCPVVGNAQLGDQGYWREMDYPIGHGDGYILWQTSDGNAYAVRCQGSSMEPRIRHGEYVIVEPNKPAEPGDEVLIRTTDGRAMVKILLYTKNGLVYLDSINATDHPRISLPQEEISAIHYIAGFAKAQLHYPD